MFGLLVIHIQGHPSHQGNEAESFIIAILGGEIAILEEGIFLEC